MSSGQAKNLMAARRGAPLTEKHNGYAVCPFTVSRSTVVFAEFDADYRPMPSLPKVPTWKESRASWVVDRDVFPQVYWNLILKGGPNTHRLLRKRPFDP